MLTSAVVFIGITLIGGLWSSGLSNIVSVILIYAGVLYSTYAAVDKVGGMTVLLSQLPAGKDWLNPFAWFADGDCNRVVCGYDYPGNYSSRTCPDSVWR